MDIAVFSDVHGNYSALQASIDYAVGKGITNFLLLGDYVTDCPYPQKTMELIYVLRKYFTTYIIRGNREEYLLNFRKNGEGNGKRGLQAVRFCIPMRILRKKILNFLKIFPLLGVFRKKVFPALNIAMARRIMSVNFSIRKREIQKRLYHI